MIINEGVWVYEEKVLENECLWVTVLSDVDGGYEGEGV